MKVIIFIIVAICIFVLYYNSYNLKIVKNKFDAFDYCKETFDYKNPQFVKPNLLITPGESKYIMELARPNLSKSTLKHDRKVNTSIRSSETWFVPYEDPVANKIINRTVNYLRKNEGLNITPENCEKIQVVRYKPGDKYIPHHDNCVPNATDDCTKSKLKGGRRIVTVLLGLNEQGVDYKGGYTSFPNIGVKYRLPHNGGLMFYTQDRQMNKHHEFAKHGGDVVTNGEKWIANVWIHESNARNPNQ